MGQQGGTCPSFDVGQVPGPSWLCVVEHLTGKPPALVGLGERAGGAGSFFLCAIPRLASHPEQAITASSPEHVCWQRTVCSMHARQNTWAQMVMMGVAGWFRQMGHSSSTPF